MWIQESYNCSYSKEEGQTKSLQLKEFLEILLIIFDAIYWYALLNI